MFWQHQDQLILHGILASPSKTVIDLVLSVKTSPEAWVCLKLVEKHFVSGKALC